jgi:hypothetical protein
MHFCIQLTKGFLIGITQVAIVNTAPIERVVWKEETQQGEQLKV